MTPEKILTLVGVPYTDKVSRLEIHCPFHHDVNPSAGFYRDTGRFWCFTCELLLDVAGFYARLRGIPYREAKRALGLDTDEQDQKEQTQKTVVASLDYERARGEGTLRSVTTERRVEAGEKLDKILWCLLHGKITSEQAGAALVRWRYQYV